MKKILLTTLFIVAFLVLVGGLIFGVRAFRFHNLSKDVEKAVAAEFEVIQLPNELPEGQESRNFGCSHDYKVDAIRCGIHYTNYCGTNKIL